MSRQSKYSSKKTQGLETSQKAIQLRIQGCSYQEIATALSITTEGARKAVKRWHEQTTALLQEDTQELLAIELASLSTLETKLNSSLPEGPITDGMSLRVIDRLLRIKEQRAKLLGLNAPEKQEITHQQANFQLNLPPGFNLASLPQASVKMPIPPKDIPVDAEFSEAIEEDE